MVLNVHTIVHNVNFLLSSYLLNSIVQIIVFEIIIFVIGEQIKKYMYLKVCEQRI